MDRLIEYIQKHAKLVARDTPEAIDVKIPGLSNQYSVALIGNPDPEELYALIDENMQDLDLFDGKEHDLKSLASKLKGMSNVACFAGLTTALGLTELSPEILASDRDGHPIHTSTTAIIAARKINPRAVDSHLLEQNNRSNTNFLNINITPGIKEKARDIVAKYLDCIGNVSHTRLVTEKALKTAVADFKAALYEANPHLDPQTMLKGDGKPALAQRRDMEAAMAPKLNQLLAETAQEMGCSHKIQLFDALGYRR